MKESSTGIRLERDESFQSSNVMGYHHHRLLVVSSPNNTDDDGGGGSGPYSHQNDSGANELERYTTAPPTTTNTTSPRTRNCSSIFFPDHDVVTGGSGSGTGGLAADAVSIRTLSPFDSCSLNNTSNSPGGGGGGGGGVGMAAAAAALGFPFTVAQWKELDRQAMIYKYMIASVPVPSDLLLPADPTAAPLVGTNGGGSIYNLKHGNRDLEPGRCKRTDGKKWRCSRDVAPHQKYCERHMHRGRPRSRKHVELHSSSSSVDNINNNNKKKSRLHQSPLHPNPTAPAINNSSPQFLVTSTIQQPKDPLLLEASSGQNILASSNYKEPNRVFGWAMDGEVVAANGVEPQWLHLMDTKREGLAPTQDSIYGTNASTLQQGYVREEPLNLFSYTTTDTDFAFPGNIRFHNRNDQYHLFLNSDLISSKQPQIDQHCTSRSFIDAWSNGDLKTIGESFLPSSRGNNLSPSSLTLSMATVAGNALDEGMGLATDYHHHKPKDCPVSCLLPFTSGGPLAEVLQPSSVACVSNPASPYTSNADSVSPSATTVSSPTGILHKASFSRSDSSDFNSPALAASVVPPEVVAFKWLS